jgi:Family of unknown function (DUF6600)/FecR protein
MKKHLQTMAALVLLFTAGPLTAQDQDPYHTQDQDQSDPYAPSNSQAPPSDQPPPQQANQAAPGIARLSYIHGDVSSQRGDSGQWVAVTVNTPVAVGDRISTGPGGRAEIQLDATNVLRLSENTTAKLSALSRENIQVQVGQGLATYSVLKGTEATAEIDTPNAAIHSNGPGDYRISVGLDGETEVTIREGSAEVSEPQGSTEVEHGQMITIQGMDNPEYKISSAPASDAWDSWNSDRDRMISNAASWRHTNRYYTGTEDLDPYGTWSEIPDYGPVWTPQQGPGWAPYSAGSWVWQPYWGWTWVSSEPWGWAPYHYGRWFVWGGNWVWWPGPVGVYPSYYPVWAPAYVSFFGWGGAGFGFGIGFGFGFGFGHVGWLPCGPGDWFHPWWGGWGGRYGTYNVTNIHNTTIAHSGFAPLGPRGDRSFSNVNDAFNNARVRSGFVSMDSSKFGRERVSGPSGISESDFRQASMVNGKMPINPGRDSFSAASHAANPSSFRNAPSASQHFFSVPRTGTGANAQASALGGSANNRESFGSSRTSDRTPSQSVGSTHSSGSATVPSSRPGWHTFSPPSGAARPSQGFAANQRSIPNNYSSHPTFNLPQRQPYNNGSSPPNAYRPPASAPRPGNSNSYPLYSRPPLNMRQPVVTPRGGSGAHPSYSAPHGGGYGGGHSGGGHGGRR